MEASCCHDRARHRQAEHQSQSLVEGALDPGADRDGGRHRAWRRQSRSRRQDAAARGRLHQGDPDADCADHLLHRRAWHCPHGRHGPRRPRRAQGDPLFRGHHHDCADRRARDGQSPEAWRRHEHRSGVDQRQRDRTLCQADRGGRLHPVPDEHHPEYVRRRLCSARAHSRWSP